MAGEADFVKFIAATPNKTEKRGNVTIEHHGTNSMIADIVKKSFPQYVNKVNTKVTAEMPEYGAHASYGGLSGDVVKAGNLGGRHISSFKRDGKNETGTTGATSDDIMEDVTSTLHELYHGRTATSKVRTYKSVNLGKDWKDMLKDAQGLELPSVGGGWGGGDNLEEFLASAVPLEQMKAMGMTPTGMWKEHAKSVDTLKTKYPWLKQYIQEFSNVEQVNSVASAIQPSAIDDLMSLFKPKTKE